MQSVTPRIAAASLQPCGLAAICWPSNLGAQERFDFVTGPQRSPTFFIFANLSCWNLFYREKVTNSWRALDTLEGGVATSLLLFLNQGSRGPPRCPLSECQEHGCWLRQKRHSGILLPLASRLPGLRPGHLPSSLHPSSLPSLATPGLSSDLPSEAPWCLGQPLSPLLASVSPPVMQ